MELKTKIMPFYSTSVHRTYTVCLTPRVGVYHLCRQLLVFIRLLFLQAHRETDRFFAASGVHPAQHTSGGLFTFKRADFLAQFKSKIGSSLAKVAAMRVNLNIDGAPITSRSHTHPSHSQASRLLTSSLSLGVPVPLTTECMRGV